MAESLYHTPLTVLLCGELGVGKTTFLQGFAEGLGVSGWVTSPTFALEQRYQTREAGELLHIDLYRLSPPQARELLTETDDHGGIRCIEWPERLGVDTAAFFPHAIQITLTEAGKGRELHAIFRDIPVPSPDDVAAWKREVLLPRTIEAHSRAVAAFSRTLAGLLWGRGVIARVEALAAAGEAHDLLRFIDFQPSVPSPFQPTEEQRKSWESWKNRFAGQRHENASEAFLRERGFPEIGTIVAVHGLRLPPPTRATIEQKLLFYADKRVKEDMIVSLDERFRDFEKRYGKASRAASQEWYDEAKRVEEELFPEGAPL